LESTVAAEETRACNEEERAAPEPSALNEWKTDEQQLRGLISSVKDYAIFLLDTEGRVRTWNAGAQLIKGYNAAEIIGKHIGVFYSAEERAAGVPAALLREAERNGRAENEGWRVRKDGSLFWANVVVTAVRENGRLVGYGKVTRDLTERRSLEEERVRRARAEEAVRLRDEFLSIASHELRTPLTSLRIDLYGLKQATGNGDARNEQRLQRAIRNADRLTALIDSLMNVSRLTNGKLTLNPEPMDLSSSVAQVVEGMRGAAEKAGCDVEIASEGPIRGVWDRLRIEQVMMNLLSNAFQYAPGGTVKVAVRRYDGQAVVEVEDEGPGVPEEDLERMFQRFERVAPRQYSTGLGLGLYVSREIAKAHGGTVVARNRDAHGGAILSVRLPLG
jgi:PAS domain S-box-containing protein